jgi:hypothetical protein
MKPHHRRQFLHLAAGAAAVPAVSRIAMGQAYPSRPVRWIVGFPAGGGADIVARLIGQWLSERLDQPFVIENRPVPAAILPPRRLFDRLPMATRFFWSQCRRTQLTQPSTTSSISISSVTSHLSQA